MLQQMRSFTKSWVANLFLGLIALSFVAWGIGDMFRTRADTNVVTMGSSQISYDTFTRDYRNILRNESQRAGRQITPDEARKSGMGQAVLDQMVNRTAFDGIADRLGLTVGDDDVAARVRKIELFAGPLGTFDRSVFQSVLQQRGYTEADFISSIRGDMARGQLLAPVEAGFSLPPGYAHALFAYSTELRAAEFITVSPQSLGAVPPPSDAVLSAFIKAHPDRFSTPEYRSASVAMIGSEDVAPGVKISDADLHKEYDKDKAIYIIPEKRDVQQIAFPTEAAAKDARTKIDGGMAFEATAFQAKTTVDDRGTVTQDALGPLGQAAFAVPEGGVTQPLKNFSSWVLLHVTKVTPGKSTSFDEAKPALTKALTDQIVQAKLADIANAYSDEARHGAELPDVAKKVGMHVVRVAAIDAQGLAPDGSKPAGLPTDPELIAHVFAAEVGEPGDPFQTTSGHTYVLMVEGVTPPKLKTLAAARVDATRVWTAQQTAVLLQKRAAALAAQAQREGTLANVARQVGAPVQTGGALSRAKGNDTFSPALLERIFGAMPNGVVSGPTDKGDAYIIARVSGIFHPPLPTNSRGYRNGLAELASQVGQDLSGGLAENEKSKEKVVINQKLLDQALGGGGEGP